VVRRCRRDAGQHPSDEAILCYLKQRRLRIYLCQGGRQRLPIESDWGAGMTRQDKRLPRQCQQTLETGVERMGARPRRLWVGVQIRAADGVQEQRVASEERLVVEQVARAFRRVPRCPQRPQPRTANGDGIVVADRGM